MKSAVVVTLAMGAAAMHIPWFSQNDNNRQTPMSTMAEDDAVMNTAHDETRMPSGQGFNRMGSNGDDIDVHVHVQVSRQGDSTMVSLDTPSSPDIDNPMGAAGARHHSESPSGMRTTYQSMNKDNELEICEPRGYPFAPEGCFDGDGYAKQIDDHYWVCCKTTNTGLATDSGSNTIPGGSSSSMNQQTNEMPRGVGGAMDDSQAAAKGMRTMGGDTGMDGHEKCTQIVSDVPLFTQCPIPDYVRPIDGALFCCHWSDDDNTMGNADSRSRMMMSGKKANLDL